MGNQTNEVATKNQENNEVAHMESFNAGTLLIPSTEQLGKLESAETGIDLSVKYRKSEEWAEFKDKPIRAYYMGTKEIPNEDGEMITCVALMDKTGAWLAGQMVLIQALRLVEPKTPVEITYRGKKSNKSSKGSTNMFDVKLLQLNITPKNQVENKSKGGKK